MKTEVILEFDDVVLAQATNEAFRRNTTLSALLEELVRTTLHRPEDRVATGRYFLPVFQPDIPGRPDGVSDDISFAAMMDILDDDEAADAETRPLATA